MTDFVPEVTDEEKEKRRKAGIKALFAEVLESREEQWTAKLAEQIAELKKPDRSSLPEHYEKPKEHRGTITLSNPWDSVYRHMDEKVRAIRNPDTDHWMAEEFRGIAYNDRARVFQAQAELFGLFRANTVEGVAGDSGAYSTGTGGTLVSRPVEELVLIARDKVSKMPRFASAMTMTKQTHSVPTGNAMTTYQTSEAGTTTQGEPTYAAVQLTAVKTGARGVLSLEMLEDADANVVSFMTTRAGMAIGAAQEAQFWRTGNGTAPNISAFAAGTAFAETTSGTLDMSSVIVCYHTCPQVYRQNGAWYAASNVLQEMSKVKDGNGRPMYQGMVDAPRTLGDDSGAMGTLMGKPVYEVDATAGTIHFGDMRALYLVGTRKGITARMSEHAQFAAGLVEFIWEQRYDGINVDTAAVQTITGITAANSL
jgi:HK97 family phage major capsid protein